jgi:hypothetical protein
MEEIAAAADHSLLITNVKRYSPGKFPDSAPYRRWRSLDT